MAREPSIMETVRAAGLDEWRIARLADDQRQLKGAIVGAQNVACGQLRADLHSKGLDLLKACYAWRAAS